MASITDDDAVRAGRADRAHLVAELGVDDDATVWRVDFHLLGDDPRTELREQVPGDAELATIVARLDRMDARSSSGPWTAAVLDLVAAQPGRRAADLAEQLGSATADLKLRVRRLKDLGLTESLTAGYRLSPRGAAVLDARGRRAARPAPACGAANAHPGSARRRRASGGRRDARPQARRRRRTPRAGSRQRVDAETA